MADLVDKPRGERCGAYREYLPDLTSPRFVAMQQQDAREYAAAFQDGRQPPWFYALSLHWKCLQEQSFYGITNDGHVRSGLFEIRDEGVPIEDIVSAMEQALSLLNETERKRIAHQIDSPKWRTWTNPEFLLNDNGVRLDELPLNARDSLLDVLKASLSPEGYVKAVSVMRINGFLGELVQAPKVLNEFSYNFVLFGRPSNTAPWGFSLYGHHLCLNLFFLGAQIILSPWFAGAEPNEIDDGPYAGTQILRQEEPLGLRLMQSLSPNHQATAQIYMQLKGPSMPYGRWNHDDQRHLCGSHQDNRIVPYEGVVVSAMSAEQQSLVHSILFEYLLYLPEPARSIRLETVRSWFHETYFCWIGTFYEGDPFYFRIQSPVILVEFDHHSGVFLANNQPKRFHIHTLLRTPNAGDYGNALKRLAVPEQRLFTWEGGCKM